MQIPSSHIVSTLEMPGHEIEKSCGLVTSECVLGINVFRDLLGSLRDIVGGRSGAHQTALRELRETCISELAEQAFEMGADAVVAVNLDYSEISGGGKRMLLLVASGTAVNLK